MRKKRDETRPPARSKRTKPNERNAPRMASQRIAAVKRAATARLHAELDRETKRPKR